MTPLTAKQVRERFLGFFKEKYDHEYVHSSSVVPHDDPTLLFANAGMNQFKPIFLGTVDPNSDASKWKRAVNTQKCIRAGGKHNDLDDVGKDVYHHTFFEMLGNWSFGDFFKREICSWAWQLLTQEFGLDPARLYVTYFGGCEEQSLPADEECKNIWINEVGVLADHVIPGNMKDNFWEMGDCGPCGPCSELHYDRIGGRNAADLVNQDDPDVLEIWNLVFMQYNRETNGELRTLPKQHVDTGMGLERLVSVVQNLRSNYDTDLFQPLFEKIQELSGCRAYSGKVGKEDADGVDTAYRVVADHARTLTVALADGGRPDNVGRGYVLRRILRRAVRFSSEKLGAPAGTFAQLVPVVVELLGDCFTELRRDVASIQQIIVEEEQQFLRTLSRGRQLLQREIVKLPEGHRQLSGKVAWRLYDTFGFPQDLTILMAEEQGLSIDLDEYERCKAEAQALSQAGGTQIDSGLQLDVHALAELKDDLKLPTTDDVGKYAYSSDESGNYEFETCEAKVLAIRRNGAFVEAIEAGEAAGLILDRTNFYAESGGQIYDTGFVSKVIVDEEAEPSEFEVTEVKQQGGYVLHVGRGCSGKIQINDRVRLQLDEQRRRQVMANHTATHVLNFALRDVLGDSADQRGSLVAPDKLRFDFNASTAMTVAQVQRVQDITVEQVKRDLIVYSEIAPLSGAKVIKGLRAVFDEAYPDPVRVVSVGVEPSVLLSEPNAEHGLQTSVEFCGGTHLKRSGHIGAFVITNEEAIAKGIRRLVALTGAPAATAVQRAVQLRERVQQLQASGDILADYVTASKKLVELLDQVNQAQIAYDAKDELRSQLSSIKKQLDQREKLAKQALQGQLLEQCKQLAETANNDSKSSLFAVHILPNGCNNKMVDAAAKQYLKVRPESAVMLFSVDDAKVICLAGVAKSLSTKLPAGQWVQSVSPIINGKGGGKGESAQASGSNVSGLQDAVKAAIEFASQKLA
jgi:alanyl-tRNA synthetase